jgi:ribosomal protein S27E
MKRATFVRECTRGGPGLDGYSYMASVYCIVCATAIVDEIAADVAPTLDGTDDPYFRNGEVCPQPIFFGEADTAQHCDHCGEYLYGPEDDD